MPSKHVKQRNNSLGRYNKGAKELESKGWEETRAGRWIDPETKKSHTTLEAWEIVNSRKLRCYQQS